MAVNTQLHPPLEEFLRSARSTLWRGHNTNKSAAGVVVPYNIRGITEVGVDQAPGWENERDIYQNGSLMPLSKKDRFSYSGTISIYAGAVKEFMQNLNGVTYSADGNGAMILSFPNYPVMTLEGVQRDEDDNVTQYDNNIYLDIELMDCNFVPADQDQILQIPFMSRVHMVNLATTGYQFQIQVFAGDDSTTAFTLTNSGIGFYDVSTLPSNAKEFAYDEVGYIKQKDSDNLFGVWQKAGYTAVSDVITATTAPATGSFVEVGFLTAI